MNCPCGLNVKYENCCGVFHNGIISAPTAELLIRSRYSAFALDNESYLLETMSQKPEKISIDSNIKWLGLSIVSKELGEKDDSTGTVEFIARFSLNGHENKLHEKSSFIKTNGRWLYVDGEILS